MQGKLSLPSVLKIINKGTCPLDASCTDQQKEADGVSQDPTRDNPDPPRPGDIHEPAELTELS